MRLIKYKEEVHKLWVP